MYCSSSSPGKLVPFHPCEELLALRRVSAWACEEVDGQLGRAHADDAFSPCCALEHHVVVRLQEPDVRAAIGGTQVEPLRPIDDIVDVDRCETSRRDGGESLRRE